MGGRSYDSAATKSIGTSLGDALLGGDPTAGEHGAVAPPDPGASTGLRDPRRYEILGEHGRGALGRVSRAHDKELGRDVAIKELIARDHSGEARFLREALITARLEHPGIVPVHEAGRWPDGTPFYAMKLVSGLSLRELMIERTTVEQRIALLHHVIAVADAIAYAHGRNVIHRDLKPSNVIVGEFGETIVIDWGLAKILNADDEPAADCSQPQASGDNELTAVGAVLGTPAYMAPEQGRGEHVDQRADVFAIGIMLWELCALNRLPPSLARDRHRILHKAGIDDDLATIIDKALDPDPARRYPHAGELANDLKAFKSGARIAARSYSPLAMLAHWVRRHRALALSVITALALAAAGVVLFVRDIAAERDRADSALQRVETADNGRILEHAALLLHTDPTAAVAALSEYHGTDAVRPRRLLAEAEGRGVARSVLTPHSDTIWFVFGDRTGAIVSIGEDRRIQLTRGTTTTTLATDVSTAVRVAYAPSQHLIAYATSPAGVSVLDLRTMTTRRLSTTNPAEIQVAPDGSRLATIESDGALVVRPTTPQPTPSHRELVPGVAALRFATPTRLIVLARSALRAVALDATGGAPDASKAMDVTAFDAQPDAVVAGTADGSLAMLSPRLVVLGTTSVCRKRILQVRFIPHTDRVAFACQDPVAGVARYDAAQNRMTIVDTFATRGLGQIAPDFTGRYVVVTDESNTAYIYDTETRLLSHYDGNAGQPSFVAVPTPEFDHVLIGDANGTVRVWDPPTSAARAVLQAPDAIFGIAFAPDSAAFFIGGADGVVRRITTGDGAVSELRGHSELVMSTRASPDGSSALSYGYDGTVRIWRARDLTMTRVFAGHGSVVEDAEYVERGRRVVSVGDDGRLLAWTPDGSDLSVLFEHTTPLSSVEVLAANDHAVIKDAEGSVWDVALDGQIRKVRDADGATVTMLRASPDGRYLATGTETGLVTIYETATWDVINTIKAEGAIRQIQFDAQDRDLLVASEAGRTQFGHVQVVALRTQRPFRWREVVAAARDVAYAPDGDTIGFVCADGGTWLYSVRSDTWAYARDHDADTLNGRFSPDGRLFASTDSRGVVVVRNVASTMRGAANSRSTGTQ